ncbi:MAG: hypothetical protein LBU62_11120 [Bacteroidales bacterium]|jgi:hypothetical protein|nr:hypothetical protein [Bacteroidales bacterium]
MELEELKNVWTALDERLNRQEALKDFVIKEMIYSKSNQSVRKLFNFDLFSLIVVLLAIPFLIFLLQSQIYIPLKSFFLYTVLVICAYGLIGGAFNLNCLMRMNFTKSVAHNALYINKYERLVHKEKIIAVPIIFICSFFGIWSYAIMHASAWLWAFLICNLVSAIVFTYFSFKRIYDKNIQSLQQSLEELKELEEES